LQYKFYVILHANFAAVTPPSYVPSTAKPNHTIRTLLALQWPNMGMKDLHKDFLGRDVHDKDERGMVKHSLDDLEKGSVVAVYMSSLYRALKSVPAANTFDTQPLIPITAAVMALKKGDL
jgi:hypothetical protein